eukprot:Phypoly_transcript_04804.p1 GENE.Phypoly_transcript_04804~~Phypoly_transcript_04804.p1  ORF type:complete len:675 (-),score=118.40 Phypoly_transcript_04804:32-2056(-)
MPPDQYVIREVCRYLAYEDRVALSLTNGLAFRLLRAEASKCIVWSLKKNKVPRFYRPCKFIDAARAPLFASPSGYAFLCITHLAFSSNFLAPIPPLSLPNMVTHLVLSKDYTESLEHALPPGLRSLAFHTHNSYHERRSFEHEDVCGAMRSCMRYVICVEAFMLETFVLDTLSQGALSCYSHASMQPRMRFPLTFMGTHNHSDVTKKKGKFMESLHYNIAQLPAGLTHLTLPKFFDTSLDNVLPSSLRYLSLGRYFNQPLNHLPQLTHLILGEGYEQSILHFPTSLQQLVIKPELRNQNGKLDLRYLTQLTHIHFTSHHHSMCRVIAYLPSSLVHISSAPFFWDCALNIFTRAVTFSPFPNLTHLRGLCTRYSDVLAFTPALTHLIVKGSFDYPVISHQIPDSVTHLSLDNCWIDSIRHHFPPNLTHLAVTTFQRSSLEIISKLESLRSLLLQIELDHSRHTDFCPPLPPHLTHLTLLFWRPHTFKIHLSSPTVTHLTIAPNVESEPSELYLPNMSLSLNTPNLTHFDAQITTRHLRTFLPQFLDPSLCPLPSLTHLTLGKSHEIQQVCRFPPKLLLGHFSKLVHLRLQDHAHVCIKELPPKVTHLTLGRLSLVSKKLSAGKVTRIIIPEDFPAKQLKRIHKIFRTHHDVDLIVQEVHKVKFSRQSVYWRYSFD